MFGESLAQTDQAGAWHFSPDCTTESCTEFYGTLVNALVKHEVLGSIAAAIACGPCETGILAYTVYEVANGYMHYKNDAGSPHAFCGETTDVVACDQNTEYIMSANESGTDIKDMSGSMVVASVATGQYITLEANQELFVPGNSTLAASQNLAGSVQTFDPNSVDQWWLSSGASVSTSPPATSIFAYLDNVWVWVILAGILGFIASVSVRAARRRKTSRGTTSQ